MPYAKAVVTHNISHIQSFHTSEVRLDPTLSDMRGSTVYWVAWSQAGNMSLHGQIDAGTGLCNNLPHWLSILNIAGF